MNQLDRSVSLASDLDSGFSEILKKIDQTPERSINNTSLQRVCTQTCFYFRPTCSTTRLSSREICFITQILLRTCPENSFLGEKKNSVGKLEVCWGCRSWIINWIWDRMRARVPALVWGAEGVSVVSDMPGQQTWLRAGDVFVVSLVWLLKTLFL